MDEPTIAAKIYEWLWALPIAALVVVWRTINGKASRTQMLALGKSLDDHIVEDRDVHTRIVERLDRTNEKLSELIGEIHVRRNGR